MEKEIEVKGYCDAQFESVLDVFKENFNSFNEIGASFAVTVNGKFVIDIWAGYTNESKTKYWGKNTITRVASTVKVITSLCALMLVDNGKIELDSPVSKYWPEFAQNGKENLPVRYLFSHTAGLPGIETPISPQNLQDWDLIVESLAAQKPLWEPGTMRGYHTLTFNYLLGELVRRVSGKSLSQFFEEEVAKPLNIDFYLGLPENVRSQYASFISAKLPKNFSQLAFPEPHPIAKKIAANPQIWKVSMNDPFWFNVGAQGFGNARSVASVGSIFACEGKFNGIQFLSPKTIELVLEEQIYDSDIILGAPIRTGLGFGLTSKERPFPNPRTIYWSGMGGSSITMDIDAKMSIAYVMNQARIELPDENKTNKYATDTRANCLIEEVFKLTT